MSVVANSSISNIAFRLCLQQYYTVCSVVDWSFLSSCRRENSNHCDEKGPIGTRLGVEGMGIIIGTGTGMGM